MKRREFLRQAALLSASGIVILGSQGWAARAWSAAPRKRLIVVFLRGAVDGLNLVVPHGDSLYYDARPNIAIPRPGSGDGVKDLDGHFGLHPALEALMPLWRERSLAFVHACGSPDPSRSHFEAQDFIESGTPGIRSTPDGWMNRLLAVMPGSHSATEAVNLGPTVPRILAGKMAVANLPLGRAAIKPMSLDRPVIEDAFTRLYQGNDPLSRAYQEGQTARKKLLADLQSDMQMADNGAPYPSGFSNDTAQLAHLIARDPEIRLAFLALGGWDTHVNEGSVTGQLANHLRPLGDGLASLVSGLGPAYGDTVIMVISEFGRTMRENGNGGTDHGHGNVMWLLGGSVQGGKVYGAWPGLSEGELYQQRDLAITTDFRAVIATVLRHQMNMSRGHLQRVLPDAPPAVYAGISGLMRI